MSGGRVRNGSRDNVAMIPSKRHANCRGHDASKSSTGPSGVNLRHTATAKKAAVNHQSQPEAKASVRLRLRLGLAALANAAAPSKTRPATRALLCAFHKPRSAPSAPSSKNTALRCRVQVEGITSRMYCQRPVSKTAMLNQLHKMPPAVKPKALNGVTNRAKTGG